MKITKAFFSQIRWFITIIFGLFGSVVTGFMFTNLAQGVNSYYCVNGKPFLGFEFQLYAACPLYIAIAYIFSLSFVMLIGFIFCAVIIDWFSLIYRAFINYINRPQFAKVIISHAEIKQDDKIEIFITVDNQELLLDAKEVFAQSKFILHQRYEGFLKWMASNTETISIKRKTYQSLHFATVNTINEFVSIHMTEEKPRFIKSEETYTFPILIEGRMYFFIWESRKILHEGLEVIVSYLGKDEVSVKIR